MSKPSGLSRHAVEEAVDTFVESYNGREPVERATEEELQFDRDLAKVAGIEVETRIAEAEVTWDEFMGMTATEAKKVAKVPQVPDGNWKVIIEFAGSASDRAPYKWTLLHWTSTSTLWRKRWNWVAVYADWAASQAEAEADARLRKLQEELKESNVKKEVML
jgi:hypothetical protein